MPPPPPSLHTLSEEELKVFEGSTRQAIENRLVILRNVQMLMEAIQGQMQLYNSVAGPVPASTFISFTPPGPTAPDQSASVPGPSSSTTVTTPATTPATTPTTPAPAKPEPYKVVIGDKEEVFESKEEYEEEIDRRRDTLLREYNLIGDEEYEAGERVREQLRAARLAALDVKPGPSGVTTASDTNVTPTETTVTSPETNGTSSEENATSRDHVTPEDTATNGAASSDDNPFSSLVEGEVKIEPAGQDGLRKRNVDTEPRED